MTTLKILIENAQPNADTTKSTAITGVVENAKLGKNNPIIVRTLIKVVIDDINYEIYCVQEYVDYLKENIKRLEKAEKYFNKMKEAKNQDKEQYFYEYTKMYLEKDNYRFNVLGLMAVLIIVLIQSIVI